MNVNAVIVAHPDDETIWASSLIGPGVDVICCTVPARDPERAIKFFSAVKTMGGFPILIPFQEPGPNEPIPHLDLLLDFNLLDYGAIATHNKDGEYGHLHHIQVHHFIKFNYDGKLVVFGYNEGIEHPCDEERKLEALRCYDTFSSADGGKPKWQALIERYPMDLSIEHFNEL